MKRSIIMLMCFALNACAQSTQQINIIEQQKGEKQMAYYITTDIDSWAGNVGDRIPEFTAPDNPGTSATNRTLGGLHTSGGGNTGRGQWNEISDDYAFSGTKSIKLIFNPHSENEPNDNKAGLFAGSSNRPVSGTEIWTSVWAYIPSSVPADLGGTGGAGRKFINVQYTGRTLPDGRPLAYGSTIDGTNMYYGGRLAGGSFSYYCSSSSTVNTTPRSCTNHTPPRGRWFNMQSYTYHHTTNGIHRIIKDGIVIWNHTGINTLAASSTNLDPYYFGYPPTLQIFRNAGSSSFAWTMYIDDLILTDERTRATATDDMGNPMLPMVPLTGGGGGGGIDTTGPVITDKVAVTAATTATIGWTTDEDSNTVVDYGLTETRGTIARGAESTRNHVVELTGLTPSTTYYYRFSSRDAAGNTTMDQANSTFTTKAVADTTKPVISGINVTVETTTANVTWATDENSSSNVDYGTTTAYGTSVAGNADTQNHVVAIAGLTEGTTYNYRVRSADVSGNESVSDNSTFVTEKTPVTPVEVSLDDLTDVALATPVEGQVMMYRNGQWINVDARPLVAQLVEEILSATSLVVNKPSA